MKSSAQSQTVRSRRRGRIRARVSGTSERPRLAVFKSNRYIYAQVIDDAKGVTLAHATSLKEKGGSTIEAAAAVGSAVAKTALAKGVKAVVFDRGGFLYAGKVRRLADAAREAGLTF